MLNFVENESFSAKKYEKASICDHFALLNVAKAQGYKTFFILNSAEHENFSANRYENAS